MYLSILFFSSSSSSLLLISFLNHKDSGLLTLLETYLKINLTNIKGIENLNKMEAFIKNDIHDKKSEIKKLIETRMDI